jgi:hypothetical protein
MSHAISRKSIQILMRATVQGGPKMSYLKNSRKFTTFYGRMKVIELLHWKMVHGHSIYKTKSERRDKME